MKNVHTYNKIKQHWYQKALNMQHIQIKTVELQLLHKIWNQALFNVK